MTDRDGSRTEDQPVLVLDAISKTIKGKTIVSPFSFSLPQGSVLALCGGNGAGKSTILRMIAGISQPTSGSIQVNGVIWKRNRREYSSAVGFMPDDFSFGQSLTAGETIEFYAALRGAEAKKRVDSVLEEVGLQENRSMRVSSFSKGMRQRLLFGIALLGDPELLVLDEPTNGLDPYWLQAFVGLVNDRKKRGKSVVFSTHHLESAEMTADYAILLHAGQISQAGAMKDFTDRFGSDGLRKAFTFYNGFQEIDRKEAT